MKERLCCTPVVPNRFWSQHVKLTEKVIAGLSLPDGVDERLFSDDRLTGLSLRLRRGAGGVAESWVYRYAIAGASHKATLDFAGHNLTAARKWAGDLQARIRLGFDPSRERAQARAEAEQTVLATLQTYLPQKKLKLRERSYRELERHLMVHFKSLHRTPLRQVVAGDASARYLTIANSSGRTTATNSCRSLSAFFSWCMRQGLVNRNPCLGVERFPDRKRDRVLTAAEIKAVWDATSDDSDYSAIIRLLLLTGARASEIGGLRWDEIYSDRIVLPAERVKTNRQHTIFLTETMRAILDSRKCRPDKEHVFGRRRATPFTGWGESRASLDKRIEAAGVAMAPWVVHDLRRTFVTGASELHIPPHVLEAAVCHASGFRHGVGAVYNLAPLEGPIRHALNVWDAHVREIVEGRVSGDRVVPLRA
jgi:integrase